MEGYRIWRALNARLVFDKRNLPIIRKGAIRWTRDFAQVTIRAGCKYCMRARIGMDGGHRAWREAALALANEDGGLCRARADQTRKLAKPVTNSTHTST